MPSSFSRPGPALTPASFPPLDRFLRVCREGLSAVWELRSRDIPDTQGWFFGQGWPPSYAGYGRMRSLLAMDAAAALNPRRVLEVASAGGALSAWLAGRGCDVAANDLRAEELAEWLPRFGAGDRVRPVTGNLFELDPRDLGQFDLVIALEVLEHVAHTTEFLRHLRRFAKPDGRLLITTPNGRYFRNRLPTHSEVKDFTALEKEQFKPDADGHLFLLTPGEFVSLASDAGLELVTLNVWGTPLLTGHCKLNLLESRRLARFAYRTEQFVQRLPAGMRARVCTAMSGVFKPAGSGRAEREPLEPRARG